MSNDTTIGRAYFKGKEGLHLNEFCSRVDETALSEDKKVRIAYLIISDKECRNLNQDEKDKEKILKKVKEKYQKYLIKAVKQESQREGKALTFHQLKDRTEKEIYKKLIFLSRVSLFSTKSYGTVLKSNEYAHAYNQKLENDLKEKNEDISTTSLVYTFDSSQKLLCYEKEKQMN